ncbi:DUF5615 family PIN-like protein [Acidithiobacillus sulfurivorans]|uniref:DUF5615 family PIN-like protein n=1 Tax=Acidithiobacillus sulfurivorans TaxID=1958756 RepID=A0ABS5ZVH5_9PROT|nr:DUF5615 family PIN-like protein [Acidithiobacillus sulfurivorans]MBU2758926.1 DUF5615 family PIN-like protein [Acidithiobacillus sulfurivorans]
MQFLVDAQLPPALARWISAQGYSASHVADIGMSSALDLEIVIYRKARKAPAFRPGMDSAAASRLNAVEVARPPVNILPTCY